MRPRRQVLAILWSVVFIVSCGGSSPPNSSATASADANVPIDTIEDDGTTVTEVGRAKGAEIGAGGGTVTATGSNGVAYSLAIPAANVLGPVNISVTPVREIRTFHSAGRILGTVELEPSGSVFALPLDLSVPLSDELKSDERVLAAISSDGGRTWDLTPGTVEGGTVHVQIHHFSTVSLILADVRQFGLSELLVSNTTSTLADTYRNRIMSAADHRTADEALPLIRPILLEWLQDLHRKSDEHRTGGTDQPVDPGDVVTDISDYVQMRFTVATSINAMLSSGQVDSSLFEESVRAAEKRAIEENVGANIRQALLDLLDECATANPFSLASAIADEMFAWGTIALALNQEYGAQKVADATLIRTQEDIADHICPRLNADSLEISPDPVPAGQHQHLIGSIVVEYGSDRRSSPGEFLPTVGIRVVVNTTGTGTDSLLPVLLGPDGFLDLELPLPVAETGISLSGLACLDWTDPHPAICVSFSLATDGSTPPVDLTGNWQGGLTGPDLNRQVIIKVALAKDGAGAAGDQRYVGEVDFSSNGQGFISGGIFMANVTGALTVDGVGRNLRAQLTYDNGPNGAPCHGTYSGSGDYNPVDQQITLTLTGSDCSGEHELDLAMTNFGD